MPYLQITIPSGKSEAEAKAILTELRDTFPLRQSQGRFLRIHFSDFLAIQIALYAEYVLSGILISAIQSAHLADFYF